MNKLMFSWMRMKEPQGIKLELDLAGKISGI